MSQPTVEAAQAAQMPASPRFLKQPHGQGAADFDAARVQAALTADEAAALSALARGAGGGVDAAPQGRPGQELPGWLLTSLALMCTLLWAGAQIGVKYGLEVSPPFALMGMRFVVASVLLLPVILALRSQWPKTRGAWARTVALGVLNNTIYLGLTALGLNFVSAGLACVLTGLNPLALAIGGALFFNERVRPQTLVGLVGALAGVGWVMAGRLGNDNSPSGALIICLANAVMVAGNLLYKRWQLDCGLLVSHAVQLFIGGVTLLALSAGVEPWSQVQWGARLFWAEAFLVFGVSFGAMLTWLFLLARGTASKAGAFLFLVPLFGLAEGAAILGESLTRSDVWGAAATTACIWYAQRGDRA